MTEAVTVKVGTRVRVGSELGLELVRVSVSKLHTPLLLYVHFGPSLGTPTMRHPHVVPTMANKICSHSTGYLP